MERAYANTKISNINVKNVMGQAYVIITNAGVVVWNAKEEVSAPMKN
jgi:hypothetical protein